MQNQRGPIDTAGAPWSRLELGAERWDRVAPVAEPVDRTFDDGPKNVAAMSAENAALYVRVAALEHLVVATMARNGGGASHLFRQMPEHLSPKAHVAPYSLPVRIGARMTRLIRRAERMREGRSS